MAIVRASTNLLWADTLADLTGAGTSDGIAVGMVGWADDQNNWYYCTAAAGASSSWTALATGGGGTLEAAVEDTGATDANMDQSFDWRITDDTQVLSFSDGTGVSNLLSLTPAAAGDIIAIGNTDNATTIDMDADVVTIDTISGSGNGLIIQGGGNSTAARWTVPLGLIDSGLTILTLETTGGGNLQVTGGNNLLLDGGVGGGGSVTIDCNDNTVTGGGGGGSVFGLTTGDGATGTAQVGPIAAGDGGNATLTMGAGGDGAAGAGSGEASDAGDGGNWSLTAGAGGDGAAGTDNANPGLGGNIALTAGAAGVTGIDLVPAGGSIFLTAGAGETANAMGRINLRTPTDPGTTITETVEVVRLVNQGAGTNGGGQFDIYVADYTGTIPTPSFQAPTGSLLVANSTTDASKVFQNTSIGVGTATGTTWTEIGAGGGGSGGTSTLVQSDQTLTTGSLSASGGTVDLNLTDFIDEGLIFDLQVTRTAGTGGDDIDVEIFTEDTFTNRIYFAEAADASSLFRDSSGIFYEDLDTTQELHIRITNQSAAAATFDVRARAQGEGLLATNTLSFTTVKTTNYTGNSWEHIKYDPSGGTFTITFPPSPAIGDKIGTKNVTASAISITVNGNGNNLEGPLAPGTTAASVSVGGAGRSLIWQYDGTVWWVV